MYGTKPTPEDKMSALLELPEADALFAAICANRAALGWPLPKTKQECAGAIAAVLQDEDDGLLERVLHHRQPRARRTHVRLPGG